MLFIDDSIAEYDYEGIRMYLGVYESDGGMDYCDDHRIIIDDNDGINWIFAFFTSCIVRLAL